MLIAVIVAMVIFSLLLFVISFKFKGNDIEGQIEDLSIRQATEFYALKKRVKVLEEEIVRIEE